MNIYVTELWAKNVVTGELERYVGNRVEAPSQELAQEYCNKNYPYLKVRGRLGSEVGFDKYGNIDWDSEVNYDLPGEN